MKSYFFNLIQCYPEQGTCVGSISFNQTLMNFYPLIMMIVVICIAVLVIRLLIIYFSDEIIGGFNVEIVKDKTIFNIEEKKIISKFIKSEGGVDIDGYYGTMTVPEDIMKVYRDIYKEDYQ